MCFSITASFSAGTVLTIVGVMTLSKVEKRQEILLASIPVLFATQQFIEGFLWIALLQKESGMGQYQLTRYYAFFVGIIWPLLIPLSIFLVEPNRFKKRVILLLLTVGIGLAFYTSSVITSSELNAVVINKCIQYKGVTLAGNYLLAAYIAATCMAFFCSSHLSIKIIGVVNIIAFLIVFYSYNINFASGWCFLAAMISGLIYIHFNKFTKNIK